MKAFYLRLHPGRTKGSSVGHPPVVQPTDRPWPAEDDDIMGLVAQIEVDGVHLQLPAVRWLQIYQSIEAGDDPQPHVVLVRRHEGPTSRPPLGVGPGLAAWRVDFEPREDPDQLPDPLDPVRDGGLFLSKLGGLDPWSEHFPGLRFLGQLHPSPAGLNFGGLSCGLYRTSSGEVIARLR